MLAKTLVEEGLIDDPVMVQLCMGIPYGAPAEPALKPTTTTLGCWTSADAISIVDLERNIRE